MMRRYEGLPNFRLHENIWYSNDATNITTDQGWALTWDVNKLKNLHEHYNDEAATEFNRIPLFAIDFHRQLYLCTISFDVEVPFLAIEDPSSWPEITIPIGVLSHFGFPIYKFETRGPSSQRNGTGEAGSRILHYEFTVGDDDYGTVLSIRIKGGEIHSRYPNETLRRVVFSNLVVRERFRHHLHILGQWFGGFLDGAEARLSSVAIKALLEDHLSTHPDLQLLADNHTCPRISEAHFNFRGGRRPGPLREGVNAFSFLFRSKWDEHSQYIPPHMSYLYQFSDYPSRIFGFLALEGPSLEFSLPKLTSADHYW